MNPWKSSLAALSLCAAAAGQEVDTRSAYVKTELMIPMRDGVELFTQIYEPVDASEPNPIMLFRTPYGIHFYGSDINRRTLGPSPRFTDEEWIFVYQDVRGKFRSEGEFEVMRPVYSMLEGHDGGDATDEVTDTYDTIEWLVENLPDNNRRVGMWGVSYPGFQTVMGMIDAHPSLVAASPQASPADMFIGDDFHHNGAFRLMYTFGWLSAAAATRSGTSSSSQGVAFDYGTNDGYEFFLELGPLANVDARYFQNRVPTWNEYMAHGTYDDYWSRQEVLQHMRDIRPAVLNVAGWFDAEDFYGPMGIYYAIEENDPENTSLLVVGPWQHGGWSNGTGNALGDVQFGGAPSVFYRDEVELPFFAHHLDDQGDLELPEALVFETGANEWRRHDHWPPAETVAADLYFHPGGKLSFDPPPSDGGEGPGHDEFVSDPANPVPFSARPGLRQGHTWMVEDQRFAAGRPDVLVYTSDVLEEDVVIAGPILANLQVSVSGTDADWIVKLIDVYPETAADEPLAEGGAGGFQQLLAGEVMRGKFRNSFVEPEPFVPGEVTAVEFDLRDKYHRFRKGHRIMVQVQSSWFPVIDRNPHVFTDIYHADAQDFRAATHRVHHSPDAPSHLELLLLPPR
jgi:putative CocE/NonD family hydrolase